LHFKSNTVKQASEKVKTVRGGTRKRKTLKSAGQTVETKARRKKESRSNYGKSDNQSRK